MLTARHIVVWLALLLALGGNCLARSQRPTPRCAESCSPPQAQPQSSQQPAAADNRGTEQSPLIVRSIKSNEEAAKDEADRQEKASAERWNKIFSGAVAIATFLQFCALVVIVGTTRRQLRAYVFPTQARFIKLPGQKEFSVTVQFTNTGQTPAYELTILTDKRVAEYPLKTALTPNDAPTRIGCLGAGLDTHVVRNKISLTENERQEMADGKLAVYAFGRITRHSPDKCRLKTTLRLFVVIGKPGSPRTRLRRV